MELNCPGCDGDLPAAEGAVTDVQVWDLVVGDPDQAFSDGTAIARPDVPQGLAVGETLVVVRPGGGEAPAVQVVADSPPPVRRVASYTPADGGADRFVDVYVASRRGDAIATYAAGDTTTSYEIHVG